MRNNYLVPASPFGRVKCPDASNNNLNESLLAKLPVDQEWDDDSLPPKERRSYSFWLRYDQRLQLCCLIIATVLFTILVAGCCHYDQQPLASLSRGGVSTTIEMLVLPPVPAGAAAAAAVAFAEEDRKGTILKLLAELDMELEGRIFLRSNQTKFQDAARTWIDFGDDNDESLLPLAVLRAASQKDVERAVPILVGLARDYDLPFRVQSGGHHKAGYSTVAGGVVLSLRKLKDIQFNKSQSMVTIGPGVRVGAFMEEMLAKRGYASVVASAARVAQGGFVLGGGFGALSRRYGLGIDNVKRLRIVLADGSVQDLQDGELFWALRGGGSGSFGVVTEMDYKVYPTRDTKLALIAKVPMDHVGSFLHKLGRKEPDIPGELVALFDRYEQEKEEEAFAVFQLTWMGDGPNSIAQGRHYMEQEIVPLFPQREHTHTTFFDFSWSKISQESEQLPWATSIRATQGWNGFLMPRNNTQFIWHNIQESLSSLLSDCPHLSPNIELWGGAISDVASNDTAFAHREAVYNVGVVLMVPNGTENLQQVFQDQVNKVSQVWPLIANYLSGAYVNYPMASLANKAYAAEYWGSNLKRLVEIKRKYDPINAFSYQQSVPLHPKSMAAQLARN